MGVGYNDKLQFAIYDSEKHTYHHGPETMPPAPRSDFIGQLGGGYVHSPFYDARSEELEYCKKLKEWWDVLQEIRWKEEGDTIVVRIGGVDDAGVSSGRAVRRHRLIC